MYISFNNNVKIFVQSKYLSSDTDKEREYFHIRNTDNEDDLESVEVFAVFRL